MVIFTGLKEKQSIKHIMFDNNLNNVYFDNLFHINGKDERIEILKISKGLLESLEVTVEINGKESILYEREIDLVISTMIYLKLQDMVREFVKEDVK